MEEDVEDIESLDPPPNHEEPWLPLPSRLLIIVENGIRSSVRISMAVHILKISRPHIASNAKSLCYLFPPAGNWYGRSISSRY